MEAFGPPFVGGVVGAVAGKTVDRLESSVTPRQLGEQLTDIFAQLVTLTEVLIDVRDALAGSSDAPEDRVMTFPFGSASNPIFVTSEQLRVRKLSIFPDTAGRYFLKIGNDQSIAFYAAANSVTDVLTQDMGKILQVGIPITIVPASGSPNWDVILAATSGDVPGRWT